MLDSLYLRTLIGASCLLSSDLSAPIKVLLGGSDRIATDRLGPTEQYLISLFFIFG